MPSSPWHLYASSADLLQKLGSVNTWRSASFNPENWSHQARDLHSDVLSFGHEGRGFITYRLDRDLGLKFLLALPASVGMQQVVGQVHFPEAPWDFQFHSAADLTAQKSKVAHVWNGQARLDDVLHACFYQNISTGFRSDRDLA